MTLIFHKLKKFEKHEFSFLQAKKKLEKHEFTVVVYFSPPPHFESTFLGQVPFFSAATRSIFLDRWKRVGGD